jgi:hypothetical protein
MLLPSVRYLSSPEYLCAYAESSLLLSYAAQLPTEDPGSDYSIILTNYVVCLSELDLYPQIWTMTTTLV